MAPVPDGSEGNPVSDNEPEEFGEVGDAEEFEEVGDQEEFEEVGDGEGIEGVGDEEEFEEVDGGEDPTHHVYATLHESMHGAATSADDSVADDDTRPRVFRDGKGQSAGVNIALLGPLETAKRRRKTEEEKRAEEEKRRRREAMVTPKDRANRLATHKLHLLALLVWAKKRNAALQDDVLQTWLAESVPRDLVQQLKRIKPKLEPNQRERVRMFEAFLARLTDWWRRKFVLDPYETAGAALRQPDRDLVAGGGITWNRPGRRVSGWVYESPSERVERHKDEQQRLRDWREACAHRKSKTLPKRPSRVPEVSIFPPGSATTKIPAYLRLAPLSERARTAEEILTHAVDMRGSRETSASLFVSLCRSLGIPARLVISPQVAPWSVAAAKVATSTAGGAVGSTSRIGIFGSQVPGQPTRKGYAHLQSSSAATSLVSNSDSDASHPARLASAAKDSKSKREGNTARENRGRGKQEADPVVLSDKEAHLGKPSTNERDYRDPEWKRLDRPRNIKPKVKLRPHRPRMKASASSSSAHNAVDEGELEPVNLEHPPTVWAEVFSRPFQRWLTVDPIRGFVVAQGNRSMEPAVHDQDNKLIYVVAFEEDGYARDVTARYTRTLNSRVAKMRPPAAVGGAGTRTGSGDWWERVVVAISRPERLERDVIEDAELEEQARKEPMPTSIAAFKDHPVYVLERHLTRDQVIHPKIKAGMTGSTPVYLRKHVLQLKNARGWMQQGRAVRPDEIPLKFIKSRAYTIEHKRAQYAAEQQGREEQDPLYAFSQTEPYRAPPVVDGRVPKNQYGRVDLFTPSMLPPGGAHINHTGAARAARHLGVHYAEAVTGFEFRKFRGTPTISGIVVPLERAQEVEEECRAEAAMLQERAARRKEEQLLKLWRRLINAVQISARVHAEFDRGQERAAGGGVQDEKKRLRASDDEEEEGGGFFLRAPAQRQGRSGGGQRPAAPSTGGGASALVQQYGQDRGAGAPMPEAVPAAEPPGGGEAAPAWPERTPEESRGDAAPKSGAREDGSIATIAEMARRMPPPRAEDVAAQRDPPPAGSAPQTRSRRRRGGGAPEEPKAPPAVRRSTRPRRTGRPGGDGEDVDALLDQME